MSKKNELVVHVRIDAKKIDEVVQLLQDNDIVIDAISTKELYDIINYRSGSYVC
jgi:saccharopine dehydrogenase-like NADP-dependent oxidoreductase